MYHSKSIEVLATELSVDSSKGLSSGEAAKRLQEHGNNILTSKKKIYPWKIFFRQFKNIIVILLVVAAGISFFLGEGVEAIAVLTVILLNALFGFFTEFRAEKSVEALKQMIAKTAKVIRDGTLSEIAAELVVPGDILFLEEGDRVNADARLFKADNLSANEAMLTGESEPVIKNTKIIKVEHVPLAERKNMVFMGTTITHGNGTAMVTGTGSHTEMGKISDLLQETVEEKTPLEVKLDKLGHSLIGITFIVTAIIAIIGIITGRPIIEMLKIGIALAIAAVPEGLPAVATITLAIGMKRMVRRNALVKSLPAVETLGSTTVICTDKTGTITENQMTALSISLPGKSYSITGTGYKPEGEFRLDERIVQPGDDPDLMELLTGSLLCSNAVISEEGDDYSLIGDPTEGALVAAAMKAGLDRKKLEEEGWKREELLPFDSETKYMAVSYFSPYLPSEDTRLFLKGAPDVVIEMCSAVQTESVPLTDEKKKELTNINRALAGEGLRVLALAAKTAPAAGEIKEQIREDMLFIGFIGITDPPRQDVKSSIKEANRAGIRIVMITGDQQDTARAIAAKVGIAGADGSVISGAQLDEMNPVRLKTEVENTTVFARVSPKNKLDIVDAFNRNNEVTAMTGDGVNDAPALKKADIGVAMGKRGTFVAREAADMVLLDDRFSTIIEAVKQGRVIFDNIQKFIHYLFSCNLSEILFIFISILLRIPPPLVAIQILWLNLVTDVFPALSLAWEPSERDVMGQPPRDPDEALLSNRFKLKIGLHGLAITAGPLFAYLYSLQTGFLETESRTIAFMSLALIQLFHVFNARKENGLGFDKSMFKNRFLWGAFFLTIALQLLAVYTPLLRTVLKTAFVSVDMWMIILLGSIMPIVLVQIASFLKHTILDRGRK
jgi:Ca2+-transporting ATPase